MGFTMLPRALSLSSRLGGSSLSALRPAPAIATKVHNGFFFQGRTMSTEKETAAVETFNQKLKGAVAFFSTKDKPRVLPEALAVCREMKAAGVAPDLKTYNYLLEALMTKNQLSFALKMLSEMIENNIQPDIVTFNLIIKMHVPFNDFLGAMSILEMMEKYNVTPSAETFSALVETAAGSSPHNYKVSTLVREMVNQKVYTPIAGAKAIDSLIYNQLPEEAYQLIRLLEKEPTKLPSSAYTSALFGLASTDNNEAVNHCFKALRSGRLTDMVLDEGLLLQVLHHARRAGDLELAHEAVFALEDTKPIYQDFHFMPLLDLLAKKGSYYRLFELVLLMKAMGIQLRLSSFTSILSEVSTTPDNMDKAYFALEDLKQNKTLDVSVFNIVVGGCAYGKDLDRTFATFAEAEKLGVTPNLETYHLLLEVCLRTRQRKVAERVWSEFEKSGIEASVETYSKYVDILLLTGGYDQAKQLFETLCAKRIPLLEGTYVRLLFAFTTIEKNFCVTIVNAMESIGNFRVGKRLLRNLPEEEVERRERLEQERLQNLEKKSRQRREKNQAREAEVEVEVTEVD